MADLSAIAGDLSTFLAGVKREPIRTETISTVQPRKHSNAQLARAAFDYVLSQIKEEDPPEVIGEALIIGICGLAKDAKVEEDALTEEMIDLLERIVESARATA